MLLQCARVHIDADRARRISDILACGIDGEALVALALRHGLAPLLYRNLAAVGLDRLAPHTGAKLRTVAEASRFRTLVLCSELVRVHRLLTAAGVLAVPYKGPALAASLYGDVAVRQMLDIDLIVRPSDAVKARRILVENACHPLKPLPAWRVAAHVWYHCDFVFRGTKGVCVDLTWRNAPAYWQLPQMPAAAWNRLEHLPFAGDQMPWLACEDLLLVLCLHGSKHKWDTLKWIVDVAELLRTHPGIDWPLAWASARNAGAERMLALGLWLAHDLLEAPLPLAQLEKVRRDAPLMLLASEASRHYALADAPAATTLVELGFLTRLAERVSTRLACQLLRPCYLVLHHVARPMAQLLRRNRVQPATARPE